MVTNTSTKYQDNNSYRSDHVVYRNRFMNPIGHPMLPGHTVSCHISGEVGTELLGVFLKMTSDAINSPFFEFTNNIIINFSSPGGCVDTGWEIIDHMADFSDTYGKFIVYAGTGFIASMGLIIYISGDLRICSENTRFLYHSIRSGVCGKTHDIESNVDNIIQYQERIEQFVSSRTKLKKTKLRKMYKDENFFGPDEAIEYGVTHVKTISKPVKFTAVDNKKCKDGCGCE